MKYSLKIGDRVIATSTTGGFFKDRYKGIVAGFTKTGLVKVSSWKGIRCHAAHNVRCYD